MNIRKNYAAAAALTLLPVAGMFAQSDSDIADYGASEIDLMETPESSPSWSFDVRAAYFLGLEDLVTGGDTQDLVGVTLDCTKRFGDSSWVVQPEILLSLSYGYGTDDDPGYCYYDSRIEEYDLWSLNLAFGANLRINLGDAFSLWVGPRVGANLMYLTYEYRYWAGYNMEKDESEVAFLYGGEIGFDINFTPAHALTAGVAYLASTATLDDKIEEQSYLMFSVGYKFTF